MYYLRNPENEDVTVKTNNKWLVEKLVAEEGFVLVSAWKQRAIAWLKDWVHLAIAVFAARLFTYYALAPDYANSWHFTVAAAIGAILYNWMREHFA